MLKNRISKFVSTIIVISFLLPLFPLEKSMSAYRTVDEFLGGQYYNNLLANQDFIDINSLDVNGIQQILVNNNSFLKDYHDNSASGAGRSAAQIIYDAAHASYDAAAGSSGGINIDTSTGTISPKIIIVMLQKEQSLITMQSQDDNALNKALGYSCPDGSGCNPAYAGFAMQVGWGAWQLRYNYEYALRGTRPAGYNVHYLVGENTTITDYNGSYSVTMANATTASVYSYTPHVFDSAYNFWKIFYYWFSATPPPAVVNDYGTVSGKTYQGSYIYTGSKTNDCKVYLNDTLLADLAATTWQASFNLNMGQNDITVTFKDATDVVIGTKIISIKRNKIADANEDSAVNIADLSILGDTWGQSVAANTGADFNGDGVVNIADLSILGDNWGQ